MASSGKFLFVGTRGSFSRFSTSKNLIEHEDNTMLPDTISLDIPGGYRVVSITACNDSAFLATKGGGIFFFDGKSLSQIRSESMNFNYGASLSYKVEKQGKEVLAVLFGSSDGGLLKLDSNGEFTKDKSLPVPGYDVTCIHLSDRFYIGTSQGLLVIGEF
jgi:hypothetical protein